MDTPEELGMANKLPAEPLDVLLRGRPTARRPTPCRMTSATQYDSGLTPPRSVPLAARRSARRAVRRAAPAVFLILGVRRSLRVIDAGDIEGCQIRSEIAKSYRSDM